MCVPHVYGWLERPEDVVRAPGAGVSGNCEPPNMVLETELRFPHPQELLTTEPSFEPVMLGEARAPSCWGTSVKLQSDIALRLVSLKDRDFFHPPVPTSSA